MLSKYDEITLLIVNNKYDVLAFTEVKPTHGTLPEQSTLNIPGYDLFTSDLDQPNSRGVVLYIKEQFQAKVVQPTPGTIFYNAIWTSIKGAENATLLLGWIYRSGTPATAIPRDVALHEAILWSANHSSFSHKLLVDDFTGNEWTPSPYLPENIPTGSPTNTFVNYIRDYFPFQTHNSIDKGTLPSQWKEAIVTPIFKKGCKSDPSNYRPVSLTLVVCKVMEIIISESILEHVKSISLQCSQQHGFTTGRSTTTN